MAAKPMVGLSSAGVDLGLGNALSDQVKDQTDELRKKKMREQQGLGASPAAMSLFGGLGGGTGAGY